MGKNSPQCVKCTVKRCGSKETDKKLPSYCPTEKYPDLIRETTEKYRLPENRSIIKGWFGLMSRILNPEKQKEKYSWSRVDEMVWIQ